MDNAYTIEYDMEPVDYAMGMQTCTCLHDVTINLHINKYIQLLGQ